MRSFFGFAVLTAFCVASTTPAVVRAEPSAENRKAARAAYGLGQKLFSQERFEESKAAFEEAFAAVPNPIVLKSIAECEARLGEVGAAIESFERYLKEQPETKNRAEIEQKLEELRQTPAVLILHSDPPGAMIALDGRPGAGATPIEITVAAGEHQVELSADGYDVAAKSIVVGPGERAEMRLTLTALPPAQPPAEPDLSHEADALEISADESSSTAMWVTGGIGVAGLVAGGVLGGMAMGAQSDFDDNPTEETADKGERLALFADVAFGVGAVMLITAAVLYMTDGDGESEEMALRVLPAISTTEAGVSASMRF